MATAPAINVAVPSGQRLRMGLYAPSNAALTGTAAAASVVASGGMGGGVAPSAITVVETGATFSTLAAAITAASSGQTISVPAGSTLTEWQLGIGAKTLTIRSSVAGVPFTIDASSLSIPGGSAILGVTGGSLTLIDCRLTGNKQQYSSFNPGIATYANSGLQTLLRCEIDQCSNGILHADTDTGTTWLLINCNIHDNGDYSGLMHNLYFGKSPDVTLRGCWVHNTKMRQDYTENWREPWGHLVKSRSKKLTIEGCRLTMEVYSTIGGANRCIDHPCGGELTVRGCLIEYRTNQNGGQGQAIGWGLEGAARISGTTFDDRLFRINIQQNTIVARSAAGGSLTNRDAIWVGVGCVNQEGWPNLAATPAPSEYVVKDNVFVGWLGQPPRVNEGPSATLSTTYAISGTDNTSGALALLVDAAGYDYRLATPVLGSASWATLQYQHPASTVARADAYRGAAYSGFGSGSDVGSISGDTITFGRDGAGVVNAASIATMTPLRWYLAAGTRMDALDAPIKAAVPGWTLKGNEGWDSVTMDWCGATVDDTPGAETLYMGPGGGHFGGAFNGIVKMDLRKLNGWQVEMLPTSTQYWPNPYRINPSAALSTWTDYPLAYNYYIANPANAEGVYTDEIFDPAFPTDPVRSSRAWTSRHTYCSFVIGGGKLFTGCRRFWEWDIATKQLALPKFPFGNQVGYGPTLGYGGENLSGWWNAAEQRYYFMACQNGNATSKTWSVQPGGVNWRDEGAYPAGGYDAYYSRSTRIGTKLWTLLYGRGRPDGKAYNLLETNLTTRAQTNHLLTYTGAAAARTFRTDWYNQSAPVFLAPINKWLAVIYTLEAGEEFVLIDAAAYTVELCTFPAPSRGSAAIANYGNELRLENKVVVVDNLAIWIDVATENVRVMRLA